MTPERPLIGVTGPRNRIPFAWWATRAALLAVGAVPVRLRPGDELPSALQGFVIGGGADIGPSLYDEDAEETEAPDPERDAFELSVLDRVLKHDIPVLGICRGAQLMNVAMGGTLDRDVRPRRVLGTNRSTLLPLRGVHLTEGACVQRLLERNPLRVNALHRQAVDVPGDGLQVVGWDIDGIPQAIEDRSARFRIGVQWHPEYLGWSRLHRRLFKALAEASLASVEL